VGWYECTVTDNFFNYVRTQETGMKVDARWFALTDDTGFGFIVKGGGSIPAPPNGLGTIDTSLIQFNALHYAPSDLTPPPGNNLASLSQKPHQLKKMDDIALRVVIASTGLGGDNSWGAYPMDAYRINVNNMTYRFNYSIMPIQSLDKDFATAYASAPYSTAASEMRKKVKELAGLVVKKYPNNATATATATEAEELATASFALMSELQNVYNKLDALLR
jgi:beta-galactosidase